MKIDSLRELFQGHADSRRTPCRRNCPSFAAIAGSFEPAASQRDKKRIIDHISGCSDCQEEFMLLLELQKKEGDRHPGIVKDRVFAHPLLWRYACTLIGLGLALTSFFMLIQKEKLSDVQRTSERGILMISPKIDHFVSSPLVFRWLGDKKAEYYILELFDEALLPVWTSDTIRDIQMHLPSEVNSKLRPGKSYFWMITAYSQDSKINESKLARFTIVR